MNLNEVYNLEYNQIQDNVQNGQTRVNCLTCLYNNIAKITGQIISCVCVPCICCGPVVLIQQGYVGILLRNGVFRKILYPGRYTYNVCIDDIRKVSLKTESLHIGTQNLMTNDNLSVIIDAVCFFNVSDAQKAIFNVENYKVSIDSLCKTTLRTVIGENDLNALFTKRTIINKRINELVENYAKNWGISNFNIEIRDVELPESLKRSMAQISEAKMEAQAKIIQAEADSKAVDILKEASKSLVESPETLNLLWFNTLKEIAKEKSNTIVVSENVFPKFLNKML